MALLKHKGVGIAAMAACVPSNEVDNLSYTQHFPSHDVALVVQKTGVYKRRFAQPGTCASDLCAAAAERLFDELNIDRSTIDVLLFVSQTPDYRMPATSVVLQHRLRLSTGILAFDINLGCSAFVYALSLAFSMLTQESIRKVLILNGETRSRAYSPKDRKTAFLFGDAGIAALIDKGENYGNSYFSFNTDGSFENLIKIKAGGYRYPSSPESFKEYVADEYGNIRSDEHGYLDGESVFNFVAREIPCDIKRLMEFAEMEQSAIQYFIFHQANQFMNQFLIKKLKINPDHVPSTLHKYGNTSSVSVPLTIVSELKGKSFCDKLICLSAFGVGLSWGSAIIMLNQCHLCDVVEI